MYVVYIVLNLYIFHVSFSSGISEEGSRFGTWCLTPFSTILELHYISLRSILFGVAGKSNLKSLIHLPHNIV
jgi:hypothetical protein